MQLIILASGKGSRLGISRTSSKLFLEIYPGKTIYKIISKIFNLFTSVIIVFVFFLILSKFLVNFIVCLFLFLKLFLFNDAPNILATNCAP